jgi:hypothetical protein
MCHSGVPRKKKIVTDITDPVIMIERRNLTLSERYMERNEDNALLFLKSLLSKVKSLLRWGKRRLRLKF